MWISIWRHIQPDFAQHVGGAGMGLRLGRAFMNKDRFSDLRADGLHRVQRCHRFLKHHAHHVPAQRAKVLFSDVKDVGVVQHDAPRGL